MTDRIAALEHILAEAVRAETVARNHGLHLTEYLLAMAIAQTVEDLAIERDRTLSEPRRSNGTT